MIGIEIAESNYGIFIASLIIVILILVAVLTDYWSRVDKKLLKELRASQSIWNTDLAVYFDKYGYYIGFRDTKRYGLNVSFDSENKLAIHKYDLWLDSEESKITYFSSELKARLLIKEHLMHIENNDFNDL